MHIKCLAQCSPHSKCSVTASHCYPQRKPTKPVLCNTWGHSELWAFVTADCGVPSWPHKHVWGAVYCGVETLREAERLGAGQAGDTPTLAALPTSPQFPPSPPASVHKDVFV
jgi:hypothetical protein